MRILLATHASLEIDSGEERTLQDIATVLMGRGHEVRFANYLGRLGNEPHRTLAEIREQLGTARLVPVPAMPALGRFWAVPSPRGWAALAGSVRWADVVVFGQFYGFDLAMSVLARVFRKPVVCSQANALFRRHRSSLRDAVQEAYERTVGILLLRRFAGVRVCNSDDLRTLVDRGCRRVVLMYPPNTDLSERIDPPGLDDPHRALVQELASDRRFKVLMAGRMTHQKGLDLLGPALLELGRARPNVAGEFVFLFAGTTQLPAELRGASAAHPGLVRNLGVLPRNAFPSVMNAVDAVVMPSRYESFGKVAAEAQSLGKPVLGTNITGLRDVVTNGVTGVLVDAWSASALASAILSLREMAHSHPERWIAMKTAARRNYEAHIGEANVRDQTEKFVTMLEELGTRPSR